jgi:phosphatidate cytidylyltransferase
VASAEPAPAADNKNPSSIPGGDLALRVGSALVLAPLAVASAYVGGWPFFLFWGIAAIGIWWEWNALIATSDSRLLFVLGAATVLLVLAIAVGGSVRVPMFIAALGALGVGVFAPAPRRIWTAAGILYASAAIIGPTVLRRDGDFGTVALLFLFAVVWTTDVVGYFAGRTLGGPKLAPSISPKKTWSGAIGGAAGAIAAGIAVAALSGLQSLPAIGAVALVLSATSQAGDLFESAIKRRFGAKDAGHLIPGHGGLMDRLDGFLAAAFVAAIFGLMRGGLENPAQGLLLWGGQ